jgi:hypothetical protein
MYTKIAVLGSEPAKIRFSYETDSLFNKLDLRTHYRAKRVKDGKGESQLDDIAISQDERDIVEEILEQAIFELGSFMFKISQGVDNSIFFNSLLTSEDAITALNTSPTAGGIGYVTGDLVQINDTAGSGATCEVTATDGVVTAVTLKNKGTGYTTGAGKTTTAVTGSGTGLTVNITTVADVSIFTNESSGFELVDNAAYNNNLLPVIDKKMEACLIHYALKEWYGTVALPNDIQANTILYNEQLSKLKDLTFQLRKPTMG